MSTHNPPTHPGSPSSSTNLISQITDFYEDQLQKFESGRSDLCGRWNTLPEWLNFPGTEAGGRTESFIPGTKIPAPKEQILLFPYARPAEFRVAEAASRLMRTLSDSPDSCTTSMGRMHLYFGDMSTEERAGWEKSARLHFQRVNRLWPYWLHFLEPTYRNYAILTSLLCDPLEHKQVNGKTHVIVDRERLNAELQGLVRACLVLQEIWRIPMNVRREHRYAVLNMMQGCFMRG